MCMDQEFQEFNDEYLYNIKTKNPQDMSINISKGLESSVDI